MYKKSIIISRLLWAIWHKHGTNKSIPNFTIPKYICGFGARMHTWADIHCKSWYNLYNPSLLLPYPWERYKCRMLVFVSLENLNCIASKWIELQINVIHIRSLCVSLTVGAITDYDDDDDDSLNFASIKYREKCLNVISTFPPPYLHINLVHTSIFIREKAEKFPLNEIKTHHSIGVKETVLYLKTDTQTHIWKAKRDETFQLKWDIDFR